MRIFFVKSAAVMVCAALAVANLIGLSQAGPADARATAKPAYIVLDILPLKPGRTVEEATAYLKDVEPYLARYGMTRFDTVLQVDQVMRGNFQGRVVNLWVSDNPQAAFKGVFSDAEYTEKFTSRRENLFDMKNATVVVTKRGEG